jgi:hypothetical protein
MENKALNVFVVGLRNAHAMEVQARELMERQSETSGRLSRGPGESETAPGGDMIS